MSATVLHADTLPRRRLRLGHLVVDQLTFGEALAAVESLVAGTSGGRVFTPNIDHVVLAESDVRFRDAYRGVSLSLADGMPIVWASRLLGVPLPTKISGSDFVLPVMERAAARGWRVYLLGGREGAADQAASKLKELFPSILVVGTDCPRIDIDESPERRAQVVSRVHAASPDIVIVGLGAPKQEIWISETADALRPAVLFALGASIDFLAGAVPRAPRWMSNSGLEWLYRLAREPRRLAGRYLLRDPQFVLVLLRALRTPERDRVTYA